MPAEGHVRVAAAMENLAAAKTNPTAFAVAAVGGDHDVHEVSLAKDSAGRIHLFIRQKTGDARFMPALGSALSVEWRDDPSGEAAGLLDVSCVDHRVLDTFMSLSGEMLDRIDQSSRSALTEFRSVLEDWRRVLDRAVRRVSRNQIVGLFGELIILERLAKTDPGRAIKAWRAKEGYHHDFALTNAVEVKTYVTAHAPRVEIHGAFQLDPPQNGTLHLVTFRVEFNEGGRTVADLVELIVSLGVDRDGLLGRSHEEAPIVLDETYRLAIAEERLYAIEPNFPGIRASRVGNALDGVDKVRYELLLDACPGRLSEAELDRVLASL